MTKGFSINTMPFAYCKKIALFSESWIEATLLLSADLREMFGRKKRLATLLSLNRFSGFFDILADAFNRIAAD